MTFDANLLYVDRHGWTQEGWLIGSLENSLSGQMGYFGPKNGLSS